MDTDAAEDASSDDRFFVAVRCFGRATAGRVALSESSVAAIGNGCKVEPVGISSSPPCAEFARWLPLFDGPFFCMRLTYIRVLVVDFNVRFFLLTEDPDPIEDVRTCDIPSNDNLRFGSSRRSSVVVTIVGCGFTFSS